MRNREASIVWKRVSILLESGMPLPKALSLVALQAKARTAGIIGELKAEVESGRPLWKGMQARPKFFSAFSASLIKVGETSGSLSKSLNWLSDELKSRSELNRKIVSALIYPAVIMISTFGMVLLLLVYVFPKVLPIFQAFNARLPWSTRLLLGAYITLSEYWPYLFLGIAAIVAGWAVLLRNKKGRRGVDAALLVLPILGRLYKCYLNIVFARTLAALMKGDARLAPALKITGETLGNNIYREAIDHLIERFLTGEKLSSALEGRPGLFLPVLPQMLSAGERSGNSEKALCYAADLMQEDLDLYAGQLSSLIEPVVMVGMGLLVGLIALSIISPIYSITQNLHP